MLEQISIELVIERDEDKLEVLDNQGSLLGIDEGKSRGLP